MSRGCRPARGAGTAATAARPGAAGHPCAAAVTVLPPGAAGPCPRQRRGAPGSAGWEWRPSPAREEDRGTGGRDAGSLGEAAAPRRPRPPRAECAAEHSPDSRSHPLHSPGNPVAAPPPRSLPHGDSATEGSRAALPGEPRQQQDPDRGAVPPRWRGAAASPSDRANLPPGCRQTRLAFHRLSLRITARCCRREGTLQCRPGGRGRRLQPRLPARAALDSPCSRHPRTEKSSEKNKMVRTM